VVLFITLYKVVLTFESADEILKCDFHIKATEQYFPVVLCIMLCRMVVIFGSADEILKCDHSEKKVMSSTFVGCHLLYRMRWSANNTQYVTIQIKATEQCSPVVLYISSSSFQPEFWNTLKT